MERLAMFAFCLFAVVLGVKCQELEDQLAARVDYAVAEKYFSYEKCCEKRYKYKRIEETVVVNNVEYECLGYVYMAYCGGECEAKTEHTPPIYLPYIHAWVLIDGSQGTTYSLKTCNGDKTREVRRGVRCKAKRECCEEVKEPIIYLDVVYQEPTVCSCQDQAQAPDVTCHKVNTWYRPTIYVNNWVKCTATVNVNLPYCTGCCESEHHFHALFVGWGATSVNKKQCDCCQKQYGAVISVPVICYNTFYSPKSLYEKAPVYENLEVWDGAGNLVTGDDRLSLAGQKCTMKLNYITRCACQPAKCSVNI